MAHKPDPKFSPDEQDKRSVIPIEMDDVDQWLHGTLSDASDLLKLAPVDVFEAAPVGPEKEPGRSDEVQSPLL